MDLGSYQAAKFELAEVLRALVALAPKDCSAINQDAPDLFARLSEDRFNLLVVGRFSRGKTSLMNAILGMDRLPTGLLPLTSVITSVAYGSKEGVCILPQAEGTGFEVPLEALPEYVTERGNPGNSRRVRMAQIALPAEILRLGFYFVDTPGLGSAIAENTRTTRTFLPEADAVMLVSSYEAPLSDEEQQIVRLLDGSHRQLFFVLNKHDTVTLDERRTVAEFVQRRLVQIWSGKVPRIFSISARDGLRAKLAGQAEALQASGLPALEKELIRFLMEDKGRAFIEGMAERILALTIACPVSPQELLPLRARLSVLRGKAFASALQPRGVGPGTPAVDLPREAVRMDTCVLCTRISDALFEFLCQYQHDLATHADAAVRLAASGGLCAQHLRLYVSMAADRDICVALTPLLRHVTQALQSGSSEALIATRPTCSLCELQASLEAVEFDAWKRFPAQSAPLICLPHLRKLAARVGKDDSTEVRIRRHAAAVERLVEDMQRYVLKRDGFRRALTSEEETDAAKRAVAFVAGLRTVLDDC
ncbi:MAG TPA: dynamin family protein [Steroidobacteraceae bacterium]|nr:dynamin family protein [Steroidobacteraceae bacterium]